MAEVVAQAGSLGKALAGGQAEGLANYLIDNISLPGGDEWAEEGAPAGVAAGYPQAGKVLFCQLYAGITGGVLELYIVAGLVLLDEGVLQEKGFKLTVGDYEIKARCRRHQSRSSGYLVLLLKVAGDPLSDISGLSHIDYPVLLVLEEVASGKMGQRIRGYHILMADGRGGDFYLFLGRA